ncbi:MAG TPA: hypothetical protein VGR00_11650, partial [Thermoanaerobaculia bacterium]|nr:hypothetical protein [Thermoanaerobaculia bacterium]
MRGLSARLGLALLLVLELALFLRHARREIVPFYPTRHDQATYLGEAYETREAIRAEGLGRGLATGIARSTPNGILLQAEGAFFSAFSGSTRLAALGVNFLLFTLLQIVVFGTLLRRANDTLAAFAGVGLLLTAGTPFFWAGGLFDFRLDFAAFCLFGVFVSLVVRSGFFESPGFSFAAGLVGALLVMHRFIAVVFVAGILGLFAILTVFSRGEARRFRGALIAGLGLLLAAPALLANASAIRSYYVVNHVLGGDKAIRAAQQGITSLGRSLLFYPRSAAFHHAGPAFLLVSAL